MAQDKISPEEKLLNLIRRNNPPANKKESETKLLKNKEVKGRKKKKLPLLVFIIIILFSCIGYGYYSNGKKDRVDFMGVEKQRKEREHQKEPITLKPYSYYAQAIAGKSIFSPLVIEKPKVFTESAEKIEDMAKNYRVKGIILGEKPEAFIEDIQSHRNFTVTIGDTIGKIEVKDMKEGRVTLGYEDQVYDLSF